MRRRFTTEGTDNADGPESSRAGTVAEFLEGEAASRRARDADARSVQHLTKHKFTPRPGITPGHLFRMMTLQASIELYIWINYAVPAEPIESPGVARPSRAEAPPDNPPRRVAPVPPAR